MISACFLFEVFNTCFRLKVNKCTYVKLFLVFICTKFSIEPIISWGFVGLECLDGIEYLFLFRVGISIIKYWQFIHSILIPKIHCVHIIFFLSAHWSKILNICQIEVGAGMCVVGAEIHRLCLNHVIGCTLP